MSEFGIVEDTMFIPMVGRIYATEKFPGILYDKKSTFIKRKVAIRTVGNRKSKSIYATGFCIPFR